MEDTSAHVAKLAEHDRAVRVHDKRLDSHGEQIDEMQKLLVKLTELERQNAELIRDTQRRLAAIESKPAKRWDALGAAALTALAGGIVGYLLAGLGIG